jgi:hypothetical protein
MSTSLALSITPPPAPRLLDLVRQVAQQPYGQAAPGDRYADWTRRLVLFQKDQGNSGLFL